MVGRMGVKYGVGCDLIYHAPSSIVWSNPWATAGGGWPLARVAGLPDEGF
eukprot:SAG11_NODE_38120_length_253_cov_10.642857_1_plen_49_part_01